VIQVFGRRRCRGTQAAQRYFKERSVPFHFVDLDRKSPAKRELEVFVRAAGAEALIDTESDTYTKRGLEYMEFDPVEEILADARLLRTPVVRDGNVAVIGVDQEAWGRLAASGR